MASPLVVLTPLCQLPQWFQDFYIKSFGRGANDNVYAYLKRELVHKILELLLDEEFMDAYKNGIVVRCPDGVLRRIFPRFFIYSADYPEKYVV